MTPFERLRGGVGDAVRARRQRLEMGRAAKHWTEFDRIRAGYLQTRTEEDPAGFDELMERTVDVLAAVEHAETTEDLLRAAAGCVVWEERDEAPPHLWRPVWSESFDRRGETIGDDDVSADTSQMLWRIAHLRTFGALPGITRLAEAVRAPLDSVPFYIFVNVDRDEALSIAAGCIEEYRTLIDDAGAWIEATG